MTFEITIVLSILAISILLFITEWVRMDVVALLVLSSLAVAGLITPSEALSGFSNPAVVTVWAILILSGGLARTGVAGLLGRRLMRLAGESHIRLLLIIMLTTGILSGFMNTIGVVSLFLPVVLDISRRTKEPPSKLLMPLAFAALLGGLNTMIGTPPNILITEALKDAGLRPFQMFDFAPVGISILLAGTLYMVLIGRHLLPNRDPARELAAGSRDFKSLYELHDRLVMLHLPDGSILHGKTLAESRLGSVLGLNVVAVIRAGRTQLSPEPAYTLNSGDRLLVGGRLEQLNELHSNHHLVLEKEGFQIEQLVSENVEVFEARLSSGSNLVGQTLRQVDFRQIYAVIVLAIRRQEVIYRTNLESIPLLPDDVLLVQGPREKLDSLHESPDLALSIPESLSDYKLEKRLMIVHVPEGSSLVGKSLIESKLGDSYGLGVMGIIRNGDTRLIPGPDEILQTDDTLLVKGKQSDLRLVEGLQNLEIEQQDVPDIGELESEEIGLVEAVLSPHSNIAGKTLRELNFRFKYGLSVLAIWRGGRAYRSNLRDMKLQFGDAFLLYGPRARLRMLGSEPDFIVLSEEAQEPPRLEKIPVALLVMAIVLVPAIFGWFSIAITAIIGVALMIITGCLTMEEAYRSISWKAVFLIAGMLPLGIAMERTGAAQLLANGMIGLIGDLGPVAIMAGFFLLAVLASQFMPNPAVAVLLAPIALRTASDLGISPYTLMMTVAVSASAAFLSPVGHAANVLVMGPGGYRFSDYLKVGIPLTLVVFFVVLLTMPIFWPF
ncbi:MAG: SLC13 family permease [Anaerolineae bacterium]|jgi:di/tricarboxylate transporter|nr:SLC13 family permease [Anaerolineae bacterium]MBT7192000.1 SLC13 family permease [Anaerolineae bacterium]MBT7992180.1 SLC13 family permease [Anaerolineae bacterium]